MVQSTRPLPEVSELTKPYWEAAARHALVMQRCTDCGFYNYPPALICHNCKSEKLSFEPVSGRGKIYTYTMTHVSRIPTFEDKTPYMNIVVELDEQPGLLMVTNLLDSDQSKVKLGRPVQVVFEKINEEITLPQFKLAE